MPSSQMQCFMNGLNHILIFCVAVFFSVLANSLDFKDTAMHMFMTGIGFHVLIAQAVMSHYKENQLTRWISHKNKSRFHGLLQLVGGSMVLLGALGKFSQKGVHFTSWHGIFGTAAAFCCAANVLGGLLNFFQPKFALKVMPPSELRFRHNLFGVITFTLGMSAIYMAYYSKFFQRNVDQSFIPTLMLATVNVYFLSMLGPMNSLLTKFKYRGQNANQE